MKVHGTVLALLGLLAAVGCKSDEVSFSRDVAPILEARCNVCHLATSKLGVDFGVDFTNPFDPEFGIVGKSNTWAAPHANPEDPVSDYEFIVDPFNPENSGLIAKVRDLDLNPAIDGNAMPFALDELSFAELSDVESWIAAGANDDETFEPVATIFGTAIRFAPELGAGRCTFCHYPDAPNGLDVLDVFDPVHGMVGVESRFGGLIVDPGNPDTSVLMKRLRGEGVKKMPLQLARLDPHQVQLIVDWILAGAPNN